MPPIPPDLILDNALAQFQGSLAAYFPALIVWGIRLLSAVTFLGFGYAVIMAILNYDWFGTFVAFLWAMVRIALVYAVMANLPIWGDAFPQMGKLVGNSISGLGGAMTPSGLYNLGINICTMLWNARHLGSWFNIIEDFQFVGLIVLTQIIWFGAACIYMWIVIECKWLLIKGPVTVCFATFDETWPILSNWFITMLQAGIRLLAAILIMGVGVLLAQNWSAQLAALGVGINLDQLHYGAIQFICALILLYAMWALPSKAARIVIGKGAHGTGNYHGEGGEALFMAGPNAIRTVSTISKL